MATVTASPATASTPAIEHPLRNPHYRLWLVGVAGLMVSRIPTFAVKRLRVPNIMVLPILLGFAVVASGLATEPWRWAE